jgi:hypothetical protein
MLDGSITRQHTQLLGANPLGFVRRLVGVSGSVASFHALGNKIYAKYAPVGEIQRLSDSQMIYKIPGDVFSEIYLNTAVTVPLSLTFAHRVELKTLALWYSPTERTEVIKESLRAMGLEPVLLSKVVNLRTVEQLPGMTRDQFSFIPRSFMEKTIASNESDIMPLSDAPRVSLQTPPREIIGTRSTGYPQPIIPVPGKELDSAFIGVMPPAYFRQWLQQRQVVNITQIQPLLSRVFAPNTLLQDVMARSSSDFVSIPRKPLDQRLQPGARVVDTTILLHTSAPEREDTKQTPERGYHSEKLPPIAEQWLVPLINQRLVDSAMSGTASIIAPGVTDDIQQFTVIRREEPLELPPLPYAFAQPRRPIAQEAQVITRVQEKEMVKLVHKEIQSYLSTGSVVKHFSRTDYARITDNVYAALARRLRVEKERLGIR